MRLQRHPRLPTLSAGRTTLGLLQTLVTRSFEPGYARCWTLRSAPRDCMPIPNLAQEGLRV